MQEVMKYFHSKVYGRFCNLWNMNHYKFSHEVLWKLNIFMFFNECEWTTFLNIWFNELNGALQEKLCPFYFPFKKNPFVLEEKNMSGHFQISSSFENSDMPNTNFQTATITSIPWLIEVSNITIFAKKMYGNPIGKLAFGPTFTIAIQV